MRKREKAPALNVELRLGQVLSYWIWHRQMRALDWQKVLFIQTHDLQGKSGPCVSWGRQGLAKANQGLPFLAPSPLACALATPMAGTPVPAGYGV